MRAAGPASDMRIADDDAFFAVDGIGKPDRVLPYISVAGCIVERRSNSDMLLTSTRKLMCWTRRASRSAVKQVLVSHARDRATGPLFSPKSNPLPSAQGHRSSQALAVSLFIFDTCIVLDQILVLIVVVEARKLHKLSKSRIKSHHVSISMFLTPFLGSNLIYTATCYLLHHSRAA